MAMSLIIRQQGQSGRCAWRTGRANRHNNYMQTQSATLVIQIAGPNAGQFSVLNVHGNANLNGFLDPVLVNGFVPDIGQSFTFMNYASFTGFFPRIQGPSCSITVGNAG